MAYNRNNHLKKVASIIDLYNQVKEPDIPDTYILRVVFPKYNIFISRRTWVGYKGMKPSEYKAQLSLF
ncbi:Uncharacterised protein [Sphingobacterium spiritivorum]|uniref:Transposase and inactivated derivatives n=1 Tax=Sphingobacterium spiritivorum TaxID=258 RepID=A0A380CSV6_SPHSI|nr:hypothetical protein [Sphingobacterium spiritivorum]SUJ26431.1 Uncharacterised protein [Sphingobacterium spiritivorum]